MNNNDKNKPKGPNNNTKSILNAFLIYFLIMSCSNYLWLGLYGASQRETIQEEEIIVEEELATYKVSFYNGKYISHYETDEYNIENDLLKFSNTKDNEIIEYTLNGNNFYIVYNEYEPQENFIPVYKIIYYNGSFSTHYYCDTIEHMENNDIIITTDMSKLYLRGEYILVDMTNKDIEDWKEKNNYTNEETSVDN